jgi:hypothetical protein
VSFNFDFWAVASPNNYRALIDCDIFHVDVDLGKNVCILKKYHHTGINQYIPKLCLRTLLGRQEFMIWSARKKEPILS